MTLLLEGEGALKERAPGVWTPGALLRGTRYVERLRARGVRVDVVSDRRV